MDTQEAPTGHVKRWLLEREVEDVGGPEGDKGSGEQQPWWRVVCLTGVDYFSTLGYSPGIAALAAGALSPIATLLIVLLTLFGALPIYRRVAHESPHGQGSIAMLENLLSFWRGKLLILGLLGFVATGWLVTITLSAADATAHIVENPLTPDFLHGQHVVITLVLLATLGAVFLRGFKEAIGIAVAVVGAYLLLNLVVVSVGLYECVVGPSFVVDWQSKLFANYGNPLTMVGVSLLVFPRLALGLSGFETGVSMMPLVRGDADDDPERPEGRIRNTHKMLTVAAIIMSFYLLTTSFVTTVLIPAAEFQTGGSANGRALAYLAHDQLGDTFGTVYDLSTIIFAADVDAQAGAYATGVLAMMTSAAFAVSLSAWRRGSRLGALAFGAITLIFVYAFVANEVQRPDGIVIASLFILTIILTSLVSRVWRTTELRTEKIEVDETAQRFIDEASGGEEIHIVANRRQSGDARDYYSKEREQRQYTYIPSDVILFLEVEVGDPSEFEDVLEVRGVEVNGYRVLRAESSTVPNAIAAFLLHLRDTTGKETHCHFDWTQGNPLGYLLQYVLLGEGDTAPVTHEVLREAERDPEQRPIIHVAGK